MLWSQPGRPSVGLTGASSGSEGLACSCFPARARQNVAASRAELRACAWPTAPRVWLWSPWPRLTSPLGAGPQGEELVLEQAGWDPVLVPFSWNIL